MAGQQDEASARQVSLMEQTLQPCEEALRLLWLLIALPASAAGLWKTRKYHRSAGFLVTEGEWREAREDAACASITAKPQVALAS